MGWNHLTPDERLSKWKDFREEISGLPLHDKLNRTATLWDDISPSSYVIDFYTPESWVTPWEMLSDGNFCQSTVSLLQYYTLRLTSEEDVRIWLVDNTYDRFLMPVINDTYVLNYNIGEVTLISDIDVRVINYFNDSIKQIN